MFYSVTTKTIVAAVAEATTTTRIIIGLDAAYTDERESVLAVYHQSDKTRIFNELRVVLTNNDYFIKQNSKRYIKPFNIILIQN